MSTVQSSIRCHNHARRAEAALGRVVLGEATLNRVMIRFGDAEPFGRRHRAVVQAREWKETRIHGHCGLIAVQARHENGARTATTFTAANLRSFEARACAEVVVERFSWVDTGIGKHDALTVESKLERHVLAKR